MFLIFAEDWGCNYASHLGAPLAWVHDLLIEPLSIKIRAFDLIMIAVLLAASFKRDGRGSHVPAMKNALFLTIGMTIFCFSYGLARGGDVRAASWQTYLILSCVLLAFTLAATFRTPADYGTLAKWLMAAAIYRGLGCWISYYTWARSSVGEGASFITTHDDTVGWVVCILILILNTINRRTPGVILRNLALIGFFLGAIQFNNRRLAWVSLAMGLLMAYFLFPQSAVKRRINRVALFVAPALLLYVAVGWGEPNPIFLPLRAFATVSTQEDASTLARNAENLGLVATANAFGFTLGTGWGRPYICLTYKYNISGFELWQYVPHNSILGLLAFTGVLGFSGFWLAIPTAVFLNSRVARLSNDPKARNVAIIGAAQMVVCANQLYGDMGLFFFKSMYVIAISYAMALRLPRAAGLWDAPNAASAPRR
jgi:hypothetical protein